MDKKLGKFLQDHESYEEESEIKRLLDQIFESIDEFLISDTKDERLRNIHEARNILNLIEKMVLKS